MSKSQAFFVFKISHRDPAVRSGSPAEIRLLGFSPEGGTSLPLVRKPPDRASTKRKARRAAHHSGE